MLGGQQGTAGCEERCAMRVFVTGASGFIGLPTVKSLRAAGHEVLGLARSEEAAGRLQQLGAGVVKGDLTNLDTLRTAAAESDGVLHLAFHFDLADAQRSVEMDQAAIRAMLAGIASSGKAFVGTTGTLGIQPAGDMATELDLAAEPHRWRAPAEEMVLRAEGARGMVIRLAPTVHGAGDHTFIPELISKAKQNGASLYPGEGTNTWQAVFRDDVAELYRLALEQGKAGCRYHGIAEPAIAMRDIALAVGQGLNLPTEQVSPELALEKMGWIAHFATMGVPTSSQRTQDELGWKPVGPTLFEDMRACYF